MKKSEQLHCNSITRSWKQKEIFEYKCTCTQEFCVIYGFMGFVISGYMGIEQCEQKWRFWKMDWILLLQAFMILEGETNEPKWTYRQAECCKECQSKECLHCRCCRKMKNWWQLHMGPFYTQNICHSHLKIPVTKSPTSDKHDIDSSRLVFHISKTTKVFVLRNNQDLFTNDFNL